MHGFPPSRPDQPDRPPAAATAPATGTVVRRSGRRTDDRWIFGGGTIRNRIVLLSGALLLVLIATNVYLARKLDDNTAGTRSKPRTCSSVIEQANNAQIAFGEMRYWMTDLAVSLLTLSETKAKAAEARTEHYLDELAPLRPQAIAAIRAEVARVPGPRRPGCRGLYRRSAGDRQYAAGAGENAQHQGG